MTTTWLPEGSSVPSACLEYEPAFEQTRAAERLAFQAPAPSRLVQWLGFGINRVYNLALGRQRLGRMTPVFSSADLALLRAIPREAGNVLVGPHPGPHDPFLMYELVRRARRPDGVFLVAAEAYYRESAFARAFLRRLGVVPVARGRPNPEAIEYVVARLGEGQWAGIFPEGDVYYSREVMPMEYGALRIAVEAALRMSRAARAPGTRRGARPILITPFAHVYFFTDRTLTARRVEHAVAELERRQEVFGRRQAGSLIQRLRAIADRLIEHKARQYGAPREAWDAPDRFDRARKLQHWVLEDLERRYLGMVQTGYERRRAIHVRMKIYARMTDVPADEAQRAVLLQDIQRTRDIILAAPFNPQYQLQHPDLETWAEQLRRYRVAVGLPDCDLGPQKAVFKILPSIDVRPIADAYREISGERERMEFLFRETETLRRTIQSGIDDICRANPTPVFAEGEA
ncbi:MAG TPA: lysophospholipid acyltransferase family protein [Burkholderiales bacterium]|nr:lysophospholipid acyltransferase family protein [Burkholderiales bacterium]